MRDSVERYLAAVEEIIGRPRGRFTRLLAWVAIAGIFYFFVAVGVEELLRPAYDPVQRTISELAVGRYSFLQASAFVALGLSLLALHRGLWRRVQGTVLSRAGLVLLAACGLAAFVAGAFPTDLRGMPPTLYGTIHNFTASVGYGAMVAASLLLTAHFWRDARWRPHFRHSCLFALAGLGAVIAMALTVNTDISGLTQRLMVAPLLLWVASTALRLRLVSAVGATARRR